MIQSLSLFRRAALCEKVGVLKCWLTGWVVLSGLFGVWFLYVIRWFNFPLGSPLGTHFWELWVVLLVVIFVYWHLAARVFFLAALGPFVSILKLRDVFWAGVWELWWSLWLNFERTDGFIWPAVARVSIWQL